MTRLSVNVNKVATLRNARGGNLPDVLRFARVCEELGADGITIHPRPDQRHITRRDVFELKSVVEKEFNIEGNPRPAFIELVSEVCPTQVTLVPDGELQLTSNHGWDTKQYLNELSSIIVGFKKKGIRVSVFVDPSEEMVEYAAKAGADRVELYTGPYSEWYNEDSVVAIDRYRAAACAARDLGLGLNAGHDLNLMNLNTFVSSFPWLDEVSIGHALIADALYLGIEETIKRYKNELQIKQ